MDNVSFIEFELSSTCKLQQLMELFQYIKVKKEATATHQVANLDNDLHLFDFFETEDLDYFWWPTEQESRAFWQSYKNLPIEEQTAYLLKMPWDYATVFEEIGQGEYEITSCAKINETTTRLYYVPDAYPYGGTEPLVQAIKAFGMQITQISDLLKLK